MSTSRTNIYSKIQELLLMSRYMEIDLPLETDDYNTIYERMCRSVNQFQFGNQNGNLTQAATIIKVKVDREMAAIMNIISEPLERLDELERYYEKEGRFTTG